MPTFPAVATKRSRWWMTRLLVSPAITAAILLAMPAPLLAKWAIFAEYEPTVATAGQPARIVAVLEIVGHEAGGAEVPSLGDIGPVFFHLDELGGDEVVIAMARKDGRRDGRYVARVTLPRAGEWRVDLLITLEGSQTSPYQSQHTITVDSPSRGGLASGATLFVAAAVGALLASYGTLRRRRSRR